MIFIRFSGCDFATQASVWFKCDFVLAHNILYVIVVTAECRCHYDIISIVSESINWIGIESIQHLHDMHNMSHPLNYIIPYRRQYL